MKHNGRVEKLLCKLSQNVQPRLSCFDDVVGSSRLHRERSRQQMLGIEQKRDSPRRDIAFRRGNRPGVLHRCDLHSYGRRFFRGCSWQGRILSDLLRHSSNTLTFELLCHVRSAVALVSPTVTQHARRHLLESEGGFAANCRMKIRTSRGEPHHSLTVAARGRVGRTRAAVGHLPSEMAKLTHNQTHAQSNSRTIEQRKPNSPILLARISIARANQRRQHPIARARGVAVDLHRPLKEAQNTRVMGPPYDSATIKYLRFDCDTTKGALWRFGEAAHLLISQRSVKTRRDRSN